MNKSIINITDNPHVQLGLDIDEYHARFAISKSQLDLIARSPGHFKAGFYKETAAMSLGTMVHCSVLEPDKFDDKYILGPLANKNTKKWKEFVVKHPKEKVITVTEDAHVSAISEAVLNHPVAKEIFMGGLSEVSVFGEIEGIPCRCRPDYLSNGFCIDLKTTRDASERAVRKSIHQYRYHVQAAFYMDVLEAANIPVEGFVFVFCETEPPFGVSLWVLDREALNRGIELYLRDLDTYKQCLENDTWPIYSGEINTISLPAYSYYDNE